MPSESLTATHSFDLVRLAKCKEVLDVHGDTVRAYEAEGFTGVYKRGKAVFVSRSELEAWIKNRGKK